MKHLVIGCGEVGRALIGVFKCEGHDPAIGVQVNLGVECEYLHICIPYSNSIQNNGFYSWVRAYQARFNPRITVIHSTVPIGTSDSLQAHHSPIRGKHPNLESSILTFVKYVGGPQAEEVCSEFSTYGIDARPCQSARVSEAGKLFDLMQYANSILIEKEIHAFCELHRLDFDTVYTAFNETYNSGFKSMGSLHFIRPIIQHQEGPIGGHCVVQNMKHLDTLTAYRVMEMNTFIEEHVKCLSK